MSIELRSEPAAGGRTVLHVGGRLDASTYLEFDARTDELLVDLGGTDAPTLVVDLSGLAYISSAGLRSLARIRKTLRARGGQVLLLDPQPQVRKVFDIVKAVPLKEIFADSRELDEYLDHMQRKVVAERGGEA